jgi:radical SAM superfamily enzyme YgiQ (UPF0313 family)
VPQRRFVSGLRGFIYRSHDSVIRTIRDALSAGYGIMHTGTDPEPETQEYFIELWRRLRREGIETRWLFESNGAPSNTFIEEFHKTFPDKLSTITVSPECGNEDLRFQHKGPAITTRALFDTMDHMDRLGITTEVFFTFGLPGENEELLMETIFLQKMIHKRYRHIRAVRTFAIEVEPGAPWQMEPERFGIVTNRRSFHDFHDAHSDHNQGAFTDFGYYIPDYFKKPLDPQRPYQDFAMRMQAIKCKRFCFLHPNPKKGGRPWKGRMFCHLTSRLIRLKPRNIYRPY